jgi:hypothetical protein
MRYGRRLLAAAPIVFACAPPERKITGSTGKTQGEIPVISPPTTPMSTRVIRETSTTVCCDKVGRVRFGSHRRSGC